MERIALDGLLPSRVGFGCAGIGGYDYGPVDDDDSRRAVAAAWDAGITLYDVADIYGIGRAERVLSEGLGANRHEAVIASKFGVCWDADRKATYKDHSPEHLREALEASLRRLRIDCLPIYQVHWPGEPAEVEAALAELVRCRTAGKIRVFGLCNLDHRHDLAWLAGCGARTVQMPFSLIDQRLASPMRQARDDHGLRTFAYNVLGHGLLSGRYGSGDSFTGTDLRTRIHPFQGPDAEAWWTMLDRLKAMAADLGTTAGRLAVAWALHQPEVSCALIGIKHARQVADHAAAGALRLPPDVLAMIAALVPATRPHDATKTDGTDDQHA